MYKICQAGLSILQAMKKCHGTASIITNHFVIKILQAAYNSAVDSWMITGVSLVSIVSWSVRVKAGGDSVEGSKFKVSNWYTKQLKRLCETISENAKCREAELQ